MWHSLLYLDLCDNPNLPCTAVYKLVNDFDLDYVISDCIKLETSSISFITTSALEILSTNSTKISIRTSQYANLVVKILVITCVLTIMGVCFGTFVRYYSKAWL